ncbi:MAG: DUF1289 domain-containing protein [Piscirickettsiaceae bacterium]|nr:MAG: DUF1289 domain-containing protein [Piscirickettsiaceae bacterium]
MESPCIRMCTLNEDDICLGCGRLLNEITSWMSYSDKQRDVLLKVCEERKQALTKGSLLKIDVK